MAERFRLQSAATKSAQTTDPSNRKRYGQEYLRTRRNCRIDPSTVRGEARAGNPTGRRLVIPRRGLRGQAGLPERRLRPKIASVDHSLLQSWLGLPPGPWPPDHYTLLGLARGSSDPTAIERVVLRPHGQTAPTSATSPRTHYRRDESPGTGPCLPDRFRARESYDAELGVAKSVASPAASHLVASRGGPPPLPVQPFEPLLGFQAATEDEPPETDVTQIIEIAFTGGLEPPERLSPPYEVVSEEAPEPLPPPYEVVSDSVVEAQLLAPPAKPWQPATRRQLYVRLAAIRRLRAAWQRLKSSLHDPREPLDRTAQVLALYEATLALVPLLGLSGSPIGEPWQPGGLVVALVRQQLLLATFRALLPDQRRAIAEDWRRGEAELLHEYARLRELSRSGRKSRRHFRRQGRLRRSIRRAVRNPEFLLFALVLVILITVLLRGLER